MDTIYTAVSRLDDRSECAKVRLAALGLAEQLAKDAIRQTLIALQLGVSAKSIDLDIAMDHVVDAISDLTWNRRHDLEQEIDEAEGEISDLEDRELRRESPAVL